MRRPKPRSLSLFAIAAFAFGLLAPVVVADAARPACTRARVGRTHRTASGRVERCVRATEAGRTVYRWEIRVTPTTPPARTPAPSGGASGLGCVAGGWVNNSPEYWQGILSRKTLGASANAGVVVERSQMSLNFINGGVGVDSQITLTMPTSEGGGFSLTGKGTYSGSYGLSVEAGGLRVTSVDSDRFEIALIANGTPLPTQVIDVDLMTTGAVVPYRCNGNSLTITHRGAEGVPVDVTYERYRP